MDGGGENRALVKELNSKNWKMYPTIEYTPQDTPQHNHMVEVGIAAIYGRGRAMMIAANIPDKVKPIVGQKVFEKGSHPMTMTARNNRIDRISTLILFLEGPITEKFKSLCHIRIRFPH